MAAEHAYRYCAARIGVSLPGDHVHSPCWHGVIRRHDPDDGSAAAWSGDARLFGVGCGPPVAPVETLRSAARRVLRHYACVVESGILLSQSLLLAKNDASVLSGSACL